MRKIATAVGLVTLGAISLTTVAASQPQFKKTVVTSSKVKATLPLRELAKPLPTLTKQRKIKLQKSGDLVPGESLIHEVPNRFPYKDKTYKKPQGFVDHTAQTSMPRKKAMQLAPTEVIQFDGVPNVLGYVPPDTNGDVGPNHYVQTVNSTLGIFNKDGSVALAPTNINALWTGFGGLCESTNAGDPIVLYDSAEDRWLISQFAFDGSMTDNHQCIAISQTGDPTGSYYLYDFPYGSKFNDYPKFGVWTDGYYMGVNQFTSSFSGGGVVAYERDKMLVGAPAQQVIFDMEGSSPTVFTPMPLDMDGFLPPPAGAKEYFIWTDFDTADKLQVWQFDVNWADTNSSTFSQVTEIPVTPYFNAPSIAQPNGQNLDSLSIRTMFRAAYRNLDGQGKIVVTHNIAAPAGQGDTALRWYEVNVDQIAGTATLSQEGTFAPDTTNRWMGSAALDANGNMAVGYSMASSSMNPSIGIATRLATDPLNTLTDEVIAVNGEGAQSGASRWGDYSSMSIDPVDDCTFWYTTEYYKAADDNTTGWSTKIVAYKIPSCTAGPRGEISGTVTDAASGEPIANATVTAGLSTTKTDDNGVYTITMPVGDQAVTAYRYGWVESAAADVTVVEDQTATLDIALNGATPAVVSGKVIDGGVRGNPLYAKVVVSAPGESFTTFTNPETGEYSISLFEGTTVSFSATEAYSGGYLTAGQDVLPTATLARQTGVDFALPLNANCTAPGYGFVLPSFFEGFDNWPATGWTVIKNDASGAEWSSYLGSAKSTSVAGAETDAAFADSDAAGPSGNTDTELVSPTINVADLSSTTLYFDALFRTYTGADAVDVDLNVDSAGWVNVGAINNTGTLDSYNIDLSTQLSGATSFQIRFRYYNANWEWYAFVDNVSFGIKTCVSASGQLKSGYIKDANTDLALNGATLSVDNVTMTTSTATSDDDALDDGFFQLFVADSATSISVKKTDYSDATPDASALTLATPVMMNAGQLEIDQTAVTAEQTAGRSMDETVTISNTGTASAEFESFLIKGNASDLTYGPFDPSGKHFGPKKLNELTAKDSRYFPDNSDIQQLAPGEIVGFFPTDLAYGWGISTNRSTGEFWVSDLKLGGADADALWRYDADGTLTTDNVALDFVDGGFAADSAFNQRTGKLWQVAVGTDNCIHEIDTNALTATGNTICPAFAVSQRGLAYDPVTDTFYSGSWNDSIIHQFDTQGNLIRSVNVGLSIAGLAYNAETKHLFISVNGVSADGDFDVVVVDAASPNLVKVGGYDVRLDVDGDGVPDDVIWDNGQAGLDLDCDGNLWIVDQAQQFVVGFESGETGACEWNNVPWLSVSANNGSLDVDASSALTYTLDSAGMTAGDYTATVVYPNSTPYGDLNVPVTMTLTEPQYGDLGLTITSVEVKEGGSAVLEVARTGGSDYAVSVDFETLSGSALSGTNFTSTAGTLSWDDLDTANKSITIPTNELDKDLSFSVVLSNPQGGAGMATKVATVTIKDQPKGGGSFTWASLLFFGLISLSRKRQAK